MPRPALVRGVQSFAARRMLTVKVFETPEQMSSSPEWYQTEVLIAPAMMTSQVQQDLHRYLATRGAQAFPCQVFLFSSKEESAGMRARATSLKAKLVVGKFRLVARMVEALAEATGVEPRFHVSAELKARAEITRSSDKQPVGVVLENISASGAKILAPFEPEVDDIYLFSAKFPSGNRITTYAKSVRAYSDASGTRWHIGLNFTQEVSAERLTGLKVPLPIRANPRFPLQPRLSVKLRLSSREDGSRLYLGVTDLSESGLRAVASYSTTLLAPRATFDAQLLWPGSSLRCRCELVRSQPVDGNEAGVECGFRFTEVPRASRVALRRLLTRLENQGMAGVAGIRGRNPPHVKATHGKSPRMATALRGL